MLKIFTVINVINWGLISIWGAVVLYFAFNQTGHSDAAGRGLETAVLGAGILVLLLLIGLNLLPYHWTKIIALLSSGLLLFWLYIRD
ncbi:hypothetical protein GO755_08180 [Spirosoma sp. HMF4905]|uniref:Uncharacterized protein n=2 Tax=Spirosoma arboris TaxID=2682092 RepID=A0A7K1S8R7_9BACT|nr:hypothetical protein [Spirosoma arboris]